MSLEFSLFAFLSALAWIGPLVEDGKEDGFWDTRSVVYATVMTVTPITEETDFHTHTLKLRIHATITGKYDAAAAPIVIAKTRIQPAGRSALDAPPELGKRAVILLNLTDAGYEIPASVFLFMGAGVREVKGYDDPVVAEVIDRIRKLRFVKINGKTMNTHDKLDPFKTEIQD
jgi:hypothetical protein